MKSIAFGALLAILAVVLSVAGETYDHHGMLFGSGGAYMAWFLWLKWRIGGE